MKLIKKNKSFYIEKMKINKKRSKKNTVLISSDTIFEIVLGVDISSRG